MCGIAGFINFQGSASLSVLKTMTDAISHRGPDGDGHWIDRENKLGLGHRRLAIIDLSDDGKQPMHYLNDRYTITFNGEIYNYLEIKENLLKKGYQFKSTSDTEVLLALFDEKKEKCLDDLDGMFSFAIWDEKEKRLFCARDRFGEKPFYYAVYNDSLYFASEMKALWAAGIPREKNERMLFNYLLNGTLQNPGDLSETFYKGIYKLKPSHYFYITNELQPKQVKYWDINYLKQSITISEKDAVEGFYHLFFESVSRRLRSDVPVGSSLSGGLDSSAVVCAIDRLRKNNPLPQATFSARFPGFARDEGKFMEIVINQTNVSPHFVYPDEEGLINDFETLCHHQEEPFGSASIYAQFCVMRLAKENNITVLLDGQGADELLAGYLLYFDFYFKQLKNSNQTLYKIEKEAHAAIHNVPSVNMVQKGKNIFADYIPSPIQSKLRGLKKKLNERRNPFLNEDFFQTYSAEDFYLNYDYPQTLAQALYKSSLEIGLEDLLRYADRNSMAHSREVRLPFLSHYLAEFTFSLPDNFKIRNGITKFIMREAFAGIIPEKIIKRMDKIGYEPPQNKWLKSGKIVQSVKTAHNNLIDLQVLHKKSNLEIKDDATIWRILMSDLLN